MNGKPNYKRVTQIGMENRIGEGTRDIQGTSKSKKYSKPKSKLPYRTTSILTLKRK